MLPLSIAIVCKNNEETIGRTLDSVRGLAREVVALDSGSTDGTLGILEDAGAIVHRVEWAGHIATKQRALEACSCDWVLSVDSDESVEPDLAEAIRGFLANPSPGTAGARVNRKVWYAGRFLEHAWQPERRLRLVRFDDVRAGRAVWGGVNPHDKLETAGRVIDLPGTLRHDSIRTFADFLRQQVSLAEVSARALSEAGARPSGARLIASPFTALAKQLVVRGAWRDGWRGWAASGATALATLAKHTLMFERDGLDHQR